MYESDCSNILKDYTSIRLVFDDWFSTVSSTSDTKVDFDDFIDIILDDITIVIQDVDKRGSGQCMEIPRNIHQVEGMFVIKEVFGSVLQVQWCKVPKQVNIVRKEFGILLVNTGAHPPSHGVKLIGLALN